METRPAPLKNPEKRLKMLRKRVRNAEFGGNLLAEVEALRSSLGELRQRSELTYHKALSTCVEVLDYYGRYSDARDLVMEAGARAYAECSGWEKPTTDDHRRLLKEKVWLLMHFGQTFYRANQYDTAREIVERCGLLIRSHIQDDRNPCHVTLCHVEYLRGQVYRQLLDYDRASRAFTTSLEHAYRKLEWQRRNPASGPGEDPARRLAEEETRAARRTALALALGLGWLAYARGFLHQALPFLRAARTLLFSTGDWVSQAYVELLYGRVQRAMAGFDPAKLKDAIRILNHPYRIFDPTSSNGHGTGHLPYKARAAYDLALAHLYAGQFEKAEEHLGEMYRVAQQIGDQRWRCNAMMVDSRLRRRRKDLNGAFEVATEAYHLAEEQGQTLCQVDALVARGEARLDLGDPIAARRDFLEAMKRVHDNPQMGVVCQLHLAESFLKENNLRSADRHFAEWLKVEHQVENQVVHALAASVRGELDLRGQDFVIPWMEAKLDFNQHADRLFEFLLKQASRRYHTNEQIAQALGVSRQTLYKRGRPSSMGGAE